MKRKCMLLALMIGFVSVTACKRNQDDDASGGQGGSATGGSDTGGAAGGTGGLDALQAQLEMDYGALTEADEAPDFGDQEVTSLDTTDEEEMVDDDFASGQVDDGTEIDKQRVIAINWGGEETMGQDWSGNIVAVNAAVRTMRRLNFEGGEDRLQLRTRLKEIPYISETTGDFDGLLIKAYTNDIFVTDSGVPPTITVETPAGDYVIDLSQGAGAGEEDLGGGNTINHYLLTPTVGDCAAGLLFTYWAVGPVRAEVGKILDWDGNTTGKVRGVWGTRDNGANVFYWKVIDNDGAFTGLVAGRWGAGIQAGRYLAGGKVVQGGVLGTWWSAAALGGGYSANLWLTGCDWLSTEGQTDPNDEANDEVDQELAFE